MVAYSVETLVFENGERYPILMGDDDMPHFLITLWVTNELRAVGTAVATISNKLEHLKWFLGWQKKEQRDLYQEFKQGKFLGTNDIQNIKSYLAIDILRLKDSTAKAGKGRNKVISLLDSPKLIDVIPSVGRNHHYNRMTSVIGYLTFLAKLAIQQSPSVELNQKINDMEKRFKAARPIGKGKNVLDSTARKTLPDGVVEEFLAVAHFDNPRNPFKNEGIRLRNYLMFHLMEKHGIRSGEMLSLTLTDMTLHGSKKTFWVRRTQDDKFDARKNQRVAKTKERPIRITDETAELLDKYIRKYRAGFQRAKKHPYLFVVHQKGETQGLPISGATFDNTIVPTMKKVDEKFADIHPHYLRHNWNEGFSEKIDSNNELAAAGVKGYKHIDSAEEAKMRQHKMGHSRESSGNVYNQRYISRKANEVSLMEQTELDKKVAATRKAANRSGEVDE